MHLINFHGPGRSRLLACPSQSLIGGEDRIVNLRILKKLSKRAAPLLPLLGDHRKQFKAEKDDSYTSTTGHDRKHWDRSPAKYPFERSIKYMPKHGKHWIVLREPSHPLKGTVMVGETSGYYEPEWTEETAWESLCNLVFWHFTEMTLVTDSSGDAEWPHPVCRRNLNTTSKILSAAHEIIRQKQAGPEEVVPDLPEGVWERDGKYFAECCGCGKDYELFQDPAEEGFDEAMSYCGGSPRCIP